MAASARILPMRLWRASNQRTILILTFSAVLVVPVRLMVIDLTLTVPDMVIGWPLTMR